MSQLGLINSWHGAGLWMVLNMSAALVLGWFVGYERYFNGRAAGSQVYCLVCTTSCAVTLLAGYPSIWYWGSVQNAIAADPTKVIGAVLTGIGFLGAGFYVPAIGLTDLFVVCTAIVPRIEQRLPAHATMTGSFRFRQGHRPSAEEVRRFLVSRVSP